MPAFSANRYGVLQLWCEGCENWDEVRELTCSCGKDIDLAGGDWKVDGNGHLWLWCDSCDHWEAVPADTIMCSGCDDFLY